MKTKIFEDLFKIWIIVLHCVTKFIICNTYYETVMPVLLVLELCLCIVLPVLPADNNFALIKLPSGNTISGNTNIR